MKKAILALGLTSALVLGFATTAQASYSCTTVDSMASSPGHAAKQCGTSTDGAKVKDALVNLGQLPSDAASRLTEIAIPANETVIIEISDPSLFVSVDAEYETKVGDSSASIARGLASAINLNSSLSSTAFAVALGNTVEIFSVTGNTTIDVVDSANVTLTDSGLTVVISADLRTNITWYMYADHSEYADSFAVDGGPSYPSTGTARTNAVNVSGLLGNTLTTDPNELYSVIFKSDSPHGSHTNNLLKWTTAHETGHLLDYLYGQSGIMDSNGALLTGTTTPGDTIGITFTNSSGPVSETYQIQTADDLESALIGLSQAINSNSAIRDMGVHSSVSDAGGGNFVMNLSQPRGVSTSTSVSSGATVSWFLNTVGRSDFSSTESFKRAFDIDILALNAKPPCGFHYSIPEWSPEPYEPMTWTSGVFNGINDEDGNPICSGEHEEELASAYTGMTNLKIMEQAFITTSPNLDPSALSGPNPTTKEIQRAEAFARFYTYWTYHSDAFDDSDGFRYGFNQLTLSFSCTALYVEKLVNEGKNPEGYELWGYNHIVPDNDGLDGFTRYRCNGEVEDGVYGGGA